MCNQYLTEEASHFVSHYFEPEVRCRYRDLPMHDDGGENNDRSGVLPIFTHPVRFHGRGKTKLLDDEDLKIAHWYVLMNCPEVEPYLRRFTSQLRSAVSPSMPRDQFNALLEEQFPIFFKHYVSVCCFFF